MKKIWILTSDNGLADYHRTIVTDSSLNMESKYNDWQLFNKRKWDDNLKCLTFLQYLLEYDYAKIPTSDEVDEFCVKGGVE